jgi:hypothetical protein
VIFIDTGAFVARHMARDQYHAAAEKLWKKLRSRPDRCYTSGAVLAEVITLISRRAGAGFAAERGRNILASSRLTLLRPDANDELEALVILEKFGDHGLSFVDALSCALMRRLRIDRVFTFDRHFTLMGFEIFK